MIGGSKRPAHMLVPNVYASSGGHAFLCHILHYIGSKNVCPL